MAKLSDLWKDVTCLGCRARAEMADHPRALWSVLSFAYVSDGHAIYFDDNEDRAALCVAESRRKVVA